MANHPEDYVLQLSESEVRRTFRRVKAGKAAGPDGVPPRVFKTCADQLAPVFSDIFNASVQQSVVPVCFKETTIVPLPKKTMVTGLNEAISPIAMKCLEKLAMTHINSIIPDSLDTLLFAHRPQTKQVIRRCHLPDITHCPGTPRQEGHLRQTVVIDFSSVFNTIIPFKLILKLRDLGLATPICNWIMDFLTGTDPRRPSVDPQHSGHAQEGAPVPLPPRVPREMRH